MRSIRWVAVLFFLVGGLFTIRSVPRVLQEYGALPQDVNASDDAAAIIAKYGRPDKDEVLGTSSDAAPSRVLTYRDMQIVFAQRDFKSGHAWKLVGFLDVKTRMALSGDEALERLNPKP